jgi:hypothetical protein
MNGEMSMNQHYRWIGQNQRKTPHSDLAREAPANAESAPGTLLPRRNQGSWVSSMIGARDGD